MIATILPGVLLMFVIIFFALGIHIFINGQLIQKQEKKYIQKTINYKVWELTKITSLIHAKSEDVHDSDAEAKLLEAHFSRQIRRLTLLSLHIENQLYKLGKNDDYENNIKIVLEVALWLLEKYDDPTIPKENRFYLWKDKGSSELTDKTRSLVNIANKIEMPL